MDKFTIPPGYPGKCTPDKLKKLADKLKDNPDFRERLSNAGTRKNQRNVISNLLGVGFHTTNPSDREQLRRHFLLYFGLTNPPANYDQCREDRTLLFVLDPPRWKDDGEDPAAATKPISFKELIETKLGPCEPDPMQELRDLVLSEITTAFGDSRTRKQAKAATLAAAYGGSMTSAAPSIAKQITFADIEACSKRLDEGGVPVRNPVFFVPASWRDDILSSPEFGRVDGFRFINASPSYQSIKKETTVNTKPLTITTKTFTYVNGVDVNNYSANELYDMIAREESKIRALEAIDNKPVMLQQEIARRKDGITALVAHLDSLTPVADIAKPVAPEVAAQIDAALATGQ